MIEDLQRRITELRGEITALKNECAAYEKVLELELAKGKSNASVVSSSKRIVNIPEYNGGSKTAFVLDVLKAYGSAGATIKEIDQALVDRGVEKGKNLIYTALSSLGKKVKKNNKSGRYTCVELIAPTTPSSQSELNLALPPNVAPERGRKDTLINFLKVHGASRRKDIIALTKIPEGTVDYLLASDKKTFKQLDRGRWDLQKELSGAATAA